MATLDTIIGVSLAAIGGTIQSFGFILQKYGHNQVNNDNKNKEKNEQKSVLTKWVWYVGIMIYTIGGTMNSIALNYAAQSIISPLSALNLATIAILSHCILKEKLSAKDIIAIIVIIIGVVVVVYFGPTTDDNVDMTVDHVRQYFKGYPYIITMILFTAATIICYIGVKFAEYKNFRSAINDEITYGSNFLLFSYVWIASYFASNNTLFIKSAVSIIVSSVQSTEALEENATDYLSYVILIAFVICLFSMEYFRQKALSHFGALLVVPIFTVVSIILSAVLGMIFFEEYDGFGLFNAGLFMLGVLITIGGVLILSFDMSEIWTNLYGKYIKVALIDYERSEDKYPRTVVYGGVLCEYCQQHFYKKPAICCDPDAVETHMWDEMEQMVGKNPIYPKKNDM
eukprot:509190_1